ncbi:hypothetical protein FHG87_019715 [Trinorchestia longiramus]|nr:hypothetical protein FHG87_019715 [Trinorchestia longiramus]
MISRIFLVVVMSLDIYALDTSPRGQADVAQVLTKCLGRETLLRWQRQLVAASRFCGGEALLVEQDPAPLSSPSVLPAATPPGAPADAPPASDAPISLEQQQFNKGVLTPLTVGTSNQPFIPSKTYPLYFQKFTFPYFVRAPYTFSKYYFVEMPQSPTKDTVLPSQQLYPFTSNVQKTSPDGRFSFVPNVPSFSKPVVHYYPVRKPGDNQYYYQPFEAQASQQVPASVPHPAREAVQRRVITANLYFIYHQLGQLVSESACERKDPGSNPAADMVDAARNTAWDLGKQPNNYQSNYPTQEWATRFVPIAFFYSILFYSRNAFFGCSVWTLSNVSLST